MPWVENTSKLNQIVTPWKKLNKSECQNYINLPIQLQTHWFKKPNNRTSERPYIQRGWCPKQWEHERYRKRQKRKRWHCEICSTVNHFQKALVFELCSQSPDNWGETALLLYTAGASVQKDMPAKERAPNHDRARHAGSRGKAMDECGCPAID